MYWVSSYIYGIGFFYIGHLIFINDINIKGSCAGLVDLPVLVCILASCPFSSKIEKKKIIKSSTALDICTARLHQKLLLVCLLASCPFSSKIQKTKKKFFKSSTELDICIARLMHTIFITFLQKVARLFSWVKKKQKINKKEQKQKKRKRKEKDISCLSLLKM